ncbi:alpha-glucosidase [Paenibacillus campi]|uniref:glycoside hydrolase family 13 protein n=1 Tax=Paenibacillus campi TaxID=3106031 RepID=UPI002AFDEA2B|nr:alpha-glucosidase [Paenibacillus sp. SGZ-1009]
MKKIMKPEFWKESVIYEIYPRSFQDSNNDGIGDIPGIISRLDYLHELGIDVIWLPPIYPTMNVDYGYDVIDHCAINPEYGTMDDWEQLLAALHERKMKLIMDLVVNHTSDQHEWFKQARTSRDNPYRDYYFWRDPAADGGPPNNWTSFLGDSMWQYDETTGQYYLHSYSVHQPDLNWDNRKVRRDMHNVMRFWLDKGVDGYRIDAVNAISKDTSFPPATDTDKMQANSAEFYKNGPHIHQYLHEMYTEVFCHYNMFTTGEASDVSLEDVKEYTNPEREEMNMVLMIEASKICDDPKDMWKSKPWDLHELKQIVAKWQNDLYGEGWMGTYLSNHDHPRLVSYLGDDGEHRVESAKMLGIFQLTLRGTPYIYQGDEIGMTNAAHLHTIDDVTEQQARMYYELMVNEHGENPEHIMKRIRTKARDNARTPMQWDDSEYAGFSQQQPWIPVNANKDEIHVQHQLDDPHSIFNLYRTLIHLRRQSAALLYGKYECILSEHDHIFAYTREWNDEHWFIMLNFSRSKTELQLPQELVARLETAELILCTHEDHSRDVARALISQQPAMMKPYESLVFRGISILDS